MSEAFHPARDAHVRKMRVPRSADRLSPLSSRGLLDAFDALSREVAQVPLWMLSAYGPLGGDDGANRAAAGRTRTARS